MSATLRAVLFGALFSILALVRGAEKDRYLLISQPAAGKIMYMKLYGQHAKSDAPLVLIESGLNKPQGIAVDASRKWLYVADEAAQAIFRYNLLFNDGTLGVEEQQVIAVDKVSSRWVAVDGVGNIFFTDETNNLVMRVDQDILAREEMKSDILYAGSPTERCANPGAPGYLTPDGLTPRECIPIAGVSSPGGIATDNFNIFWTNKANGRAMGSVVKGSEDPPSTGIEASVGRIAQTSAKAYGVCVAGNNIFYTDDRTMVYEVGKHGGSAVVVTDKLVEPRGCVWDGDGTVFIADRGGEDGGAVYAMPALSRSMRAMKVEKLSDFRDAFGLAVVTSTEPAEEITPPASESKNGATPRGAPTTFAAMLLSVATSLFFGLLSVSRD